MKAPVSGSILTVAAISLAAALLVLLSVFAVRRRAQKGQPQKVTSPAH